jgi:cell division protein FtsI/penicillin-binding protein 2
MTRAAGHARRFDVVVVVLLLAMGAMAVRQALLLRQLDDPRTPEAQQIAQRMRRARDGQQIICPAPARPGNIFARGKHSYVLVAGSRLVPSCFIDPSLCTPEELGRLSIHLAELLNLDAVELYNNIMLRSDRQFAWVAREMTPAQARLIEESVDHRAVGLKYEWRREYPAGQAGATVLGFTNKNDEPGGGIHSIVHQAVLGRDGRRVLLGDARRRPITLEPTVSTRPVDGGNVYLTIDLVIQGYLDQAVGEAVETYDAMWGVGVVVNPWTGEILAMTSMPSFDPNAFNTAPPEQMLNRAICCPYEPGSILKPIMAAAAVDAGVATWRTHFDCEDGTYLADRGGRITDHGHHYGLLSVEEIIVKSSNIGMAKIGEKLGNAMMYDIVRRWGFGEPTGVSLPGESGGIVRDAGKWDGYSMRRVPFGQEISTTALQMAMAFAALANGGQLMRPRLIDRICDAQGRVIAASEPEVIRRVVSQTTAEQALQVMHQVIERGTGRRAKLANYSAWGKTGTAQVPGPGGYAEGQYTGSFVAGAPVYRPAAVCLISIYRPDRSKGYYGGVVAAPYVADVLEKTLTYLQVPPDVPARHVAARGRDGDPQAAVGMLGAGW